MGIGDIWGLVRKVERLLELESLHGEALKELKAGFIEMDRRLTRIEAQPGLTNPNARRSTPPLPGTWTGFRGLRPPLPIRGKAYRCNKPQGA